MGRKRAKNGKLHFFVKKWNSRKICEFCEISHFCTFSHFSAHLAQTSIGAMVSLVLLGPESLNSLFFRKKCEFAENQHFLRKSAYFIDLRFSVKFKFSTDLHLHNINLGFVFIGVGEQWNFRNSTIQNFILMNLTSKCFFKNLS